MHALIVLNSLSPPLRLALGIPIKIARSTQPPLRYKEVSAEETELNYRLFSGVIQ